MKYYLAIDQTRSTNEDKSDRYKTIKLESILNFKLDSIDGITNFTGRFENEANLFAYLAKFNLVDAKDASKHFCICYKSPKRNGIDGKWNKCGKRVQGQSDILFKDEAILFNPPSLINHLLSMQINNMTFTSYDNLNENEKINLSILQMISKELLTNDFYKYDDIYESAYGLLNYVKDIKNGYVNNKYYFKYVSLLVEHLSFRYDKFDTDKVKPLKNKDGVTYLNKRHLYEFVIYLVHIEREFNKSLENKKQVANNYEENTQLSFF